MGSIFGVFKKKRGGGILDLGVDVFVAILLMHAHGTSCNKNGNR